MSASSHIELSLQKVRQIFDKNNYTIHALYIHETVKFIQLESPTAYKTFFVYIPDNYKLNNDVSDYLYTLVDITPSAISHRQKNYMESVLNVKITKDAPNNNKSNIRLLSISDRYLCALIKTSDSSGYDIQNYVFGKAPVEPAPIDSITQLEQDVQQLLQDKTREIKPTTKMRIIEKGKSENLIFDESIIPSDDEHDLSTIELPKTDEPNSELTEKESQNTKINIHTDNCVPIFTQFVSNGILYIYISLKDFHKVVDKYESTLIREYGILDDMIHKLQELQMTHTNLLIDNLKLKYSQTINTYKTKRDNIQQQLIRLSQVLHKMLDSEKTAFDDKKQSIKDLINKTRMTLSDLNLQYAMCTDFMDEYSNNIQNTLNDVLQLSDHTSTI